MFAGWSSRERLALIISGGVVIIAFLVALVLLALHGADSATIVGFIATLVSMANTIQLAQQRATINALQQQTNGQQSKMLDSIIASPSNPTPGKENANAV